MRILKTIKKDVREEFVKPIPHLKSLREDLNIFGKVLIYPLFLFFVWLFTGIGVVTIIFIDILEPVFVFLFGKRERGDDQ